MSSICRSEALAPAPAPLVAPLDLEVEHVTEYRYASAVELAQHIAVLKPRDSDAQRLRAYALDIVPPPAHLHEDRDVYGNHRHLFTLTTAHDQLQVRATSRVTALPAAPAAAPALDWQQAREQWRYVAGRPFDAATEFTFASTLIAHHAALRDWARPSFAPGRPLDAAATELMHRLHADFTYAPHSTEVGTPLLQAFEQRRGVCQDFAHVMIGALRALGLAARYVSGYLLTEPPPGQPRLQGADASHAWVAVAIPRADGGTDWLELDPTNDCEAGPTHVRLAQGRDYADVTPLCGVIRGGGRHHLEVRVSTRVVPAA